MPRIRTLKPEHRQHRKVGPLSDRTYRLWVGMILEADDEGRLVCDAAQLRALIFAYHPKVPIAAIEASLAALETTGLIRLYTVGRVATPISPPGTITSASTRTRDLSYRNISIRRMVLERSQNILA